MLHSDSRCCLQVEETTELIAVQLAGLAAASALVSAPEAFGAFQASSVFTSVVDCWVAGVPSLLFVRLVSIYQLVQEAVLGWSIQTPGYD